MEKKVGRSKESSWRQKESKMKVNKIRIIHIIAPDIIKTDVANFRHLVQSLTGKPPSNSHHQDYTNTPPPPPETETAHHHHTDHDDVVVKEQVIGGPSCNALINSSAGYLEGFISEFGTDYLPLLPNFDHDPNIIHGFQLEHPLLS